MQDLDKHILQDYKTTKLPKMAIHIANILIYFFNENFI